MTIEQELVKKLRSSNLRPTKQRLEICRVLFDRQKTFHFTISDLAQILNEKSKNKISLATIYNTVDVLKSKGHLKEISVVDFDHMDVVRHPLVSKIVKAYSDQKTD